MHADQSGVEISTVVCFPFADMVSVRALEPEFAGNHVHLVPGIDRDLEGMVVHLLHEGPTVLVVLQSEALVPERLEAILATFSKQRGRQHRLCVVEFDADAPADALAEVADAVADMRTRAAEPIGAAHVPSGPSRREDPVPEPVAAARSSSRESQPEVPPEQSGELDSAQFDLNATNPGVTEGETTFPDLELSAAQVRRGRKERQTRRTRRRAVTALSVGAAAFAAAAAVWVQSPDAFDVDSEVRTAAAAPVKMPKRVKSTPTVAPVKAPFVPEPSPSEASRAADEARRIAAALDGHKIHALDALLVRTASRTPEPFGDGRRRCEKLEVSGLGQWRVPTLDELRALRRARLLPEGEFWSASSRVRGVHHTLSRDVTRPLERASEDGEHAATLCVRRR